MRRVHTLKSHTSVSSDPTSQDLPVPSGVTWHVPTLKSASSSVANQKGHDPIGESCQRGFETRGRSLPLCPLPPASNYMLPFKEEQVPWGDLLSPYRLFALWAHHWLPGTLRMPPEDALLEPPAPSALRASGQLP